MEDAPCLYAHFAVRFAAWSRGIEQAAVGLGKPLDAEMETVAREIGIQRPDRVRIQIVEEIPFPWHDAELMAMGKRLGLVGEGIRGNAQVFGYAILSVAEYAQSLEKMAHELVHVRQVEREGSFEAFVCRYLTEVHTFGYANAPLEREAYAANIRYGRK